MERLTQRDEFGSADIIALSDMMPELYAELSFSEMNALTDALNRLAAYEDTGLEPEDFKKVFNEDAILKLAAQCFETTPDHLRELAEAEKDGRLVVLPCTADSGATLHHFDGYDYQADHWNIYLTACRDADTPTGYTSCLLSIKEVEAELEARRGGGTDEI